MPRISKIGFTQTFNSHHAVAVAEFGEGRSDCAVKAIAIACDVPYAVAHAACKKLGRKDRDGTLVEIIIAAIKSLGFRVRVWSFMERREMIARYPGAHKNLHSITSHHMRRFPAAWAGCHRNLIMGNPRHIWAVKNGVCEDWSVNKSLRVDYVWEVEKV
jgi:hypothetical protein